MAPAPGDHTRRVFTPAQAPVAPSTVPQPSCRPPHLADLPARDRLLFPTTGQHLDSAADDFGDPGHLTSQSLIQHRNRAQQCNPNARTKGGPMRADTVTTE